MPSTTSFTTATLAALSSPGQSCPKQVLNQNQWGGVIGGPIKKDKLFIFGSFQDTGAKNGVNSAGNS